MTDKTIAQRALEVRDAAKQIIRQGPRPNGYELDILAMLYELAQLIYDSQPLAGRYFHDDMRAPKDRT